MKNIQIFRTRYAPSPTGFLHIGNARTALFAYLLTKHYKGKFIIRVEDTDLKRNVTEGVKNQLENLKWLGVNYDEGPFKENPKYAPYYQSKRLHLYKKYLDILVQNGFVYPCFCTKENLQKMKEKQKLNGKKTFMYDGTCFKIDANKRKELLEKKVKHVFRFSVSKKKEKIVWNDLIRGVISFNTRDIEDFIIIKSDGYPVYNFANVIDDYLMDITHVIRGEEHISNTPKQIILYEALSWKMPKFAHLPIIINNNNKKLSKRDKNEIQFFNQFKKEKILPQAIFNYLSFLGWSSGEEREIYSKKELIKLFDFSRISKAPAKYNTTKLLWYNKEYLKKLKEDDEYYLKKDLFYKKDFNLINYKYKIINLNHLISNILGINEWTLNDHQKVVSEILKNIKTNFINKQYSFVNDNLDFKNIFLKYLNYLKILNYDNKKKIFFFLENIDYWKNNIKIKLNSIMKEFKVSPKFFYPTIRYFLTNEDKGPELWRIIIITSIIKTINEVKHKNKI